MNEPYRDKAWLGQKYTVEELSTSEIAKLGGCNPWTVGRWLKKYGIPLRSRRAGVHIACEVCGKEFYVRQSRIGKARFCSKSCAAKVRKRKSNQVVRAGEMISCEVCGKEFYINAWQVENMKRRFCSKECRGKWHSETLVGERASQWAGGISTEQVRQCEICGREFVTRDFRKSESYGRFCSRECRGKYLVGKNAPNWQGGKSFEPYPASFNRGFKQLIKERDDYTCVVCSLVGEDVHHINYVKADTNPGNCLTLCKGCHGRTNVNRDYWPSFLKGLMLEQVALVSLVI